MSYIGELFFACVISFILGWFVNIYLGIGFFAVSYGVGLEEIYPDRRKSPPSKLRTPKAPSLPW